MTLSLTRTALLLLVVWLFAATSAQAGWWIFGKKAPDGVQFRELTINTLSFEETDTEITLYRDALPNGLVRIAGQATSSNGKIGSVQVSTDAQATWQKAKLTKSGVFEFTFTPTMGTPYTVCVKAIDTTNTTNDLAATKKVVTVVERDLRKEVQASLDAMVAAYCAEQPTQFMACVSENFTADDAVLDRAIRSDFSLFDNIDLRCTVSSLATGKGGNLYVAVTYTRFLVAKANGKTYKDTGVTEFVFAAEGGGWKIYAMKMPLLFGVSAPADVATGVVRAAENTAVIVVTPKNDVQIVNIKDAEKIAQGEPTSDPIPIITVTMRYTGAIDIPIYAFDTDTLGTEAQVAGQIPPRTGDMGLAGGYWIFKPATTGVKLAQGIQNLTEAPAAGYIALNHIKAPAAGDAYAIKLPNGKYVLAEVVSYSYTPLPGANDPAFVTDSTITVKCKYQPNGTAKF